MIGEVDIVEIGIVVNDIVLLSVYSLLSPLRNRIFKVYLVPGVKFPIL